MNGDAGRTLANKYRLMKKLGQGGMGSVWYAEHLTLRSPVAIKLIDPALIENPEACGRFMREAQSAAALRSPHVVQILDYGVDGEIPFIAMELLEGESLADRLARVQKLSPGETARIVVDVCRAVGRAHQAGIVHRDLKPDNIFLVPNDESEIAKVLDFGIAKSAVSGMAAGSGTRTGAMLGTPYYMSPEQASGSKKVDWRTDLWALGIIAFECMTGRRPFEAETFGGLVLAICAEVLPHPSSVAAVPVGFDEWFARAVTRDQEQRFQSAKELAQALTAVCGSDIGSQFALPGGIPSAMAAGFASQHPSLASQYAISENQRPLVSTTVAALASPHAISENQRPLVSTTVAGALSFTGMPELARGSAHFRWVLAAFSALAVMGGAGIFAWKLYGSDTPASPPSSPVTMPQLTSALAVAPMVSSAPSKVAPVSPIASASMSASAEPEAEVPNDPRHRPASWRPATPGRPVSIPAAVNVPNQIASPSPAAVTPPPLPVSPPPVPPNAPPAPPAANTNSDPLGI